jgi:hypothetical protein
MLTVEDFSERLFRKMLAVRAPARRFSRKRASPRPLPDLVRSPSQGELALDPEENRAVACSRLTDLLRKASSDASLVKVPLRCLRDAILLNATRAGENSREVEALFSLFDGVVALCHSLQSRGAPGPYETVERAVRLRLFLCVTGESWKDHAGLRACALRKLRAFAVEETESFPSPPSAEAAAGGLAATPGRTTVVVAKDAASAPSRLPRTRSTSSQDRSPATASSFLFRRAPANVHAAIDVSSWRAVYAELLKASPSRMMPVVSALLDTLRAIESFGGTNDSNSARIARTKTIDRGKVQSSFPRMPRRRLSCGGFSTSRRRRRTRIRKKTTRPSRRRRRYPRDGIASTRRRPALLLQTSRHRTLHRTRFMSASTPIRAPSGGTSSTRS